MNSDNEPIQGQSGQETITVQPAPIQYGWKCPVCGRGLSPWTAVCPCVQVTMPPYPVNPHPPYIPPTTPYWPSIPWALPVTICSVKP